MLFSCSKETNPPTGKLSVIPKPVTLDPGEGVFTLDRNTVVIAPGDARNVGSYLIDLVNSSSSFRLAFGSDEDDHSGGIIRLQLAPKDSTDESYELAVQTKEIVLRANSRAGLMNGVQTLRQLMPPSLEDKKTKIDAWSIPVVKIKDEPRFMWRGMHLDVSRHFFSVEFLKVFIDRLSLYKFNKLHLHLTDDQGWRLEIKQYPQLTDHGAWRSLNNQDSACLRLSDTNPDFALPQEFFKATEDGKKYGGFYSQEEMRDIIEYATERSITIVPEIDMPGHMNAAINEFPDLTCVDAGGWGKLFSRPLCPCEETTYAFIDNIIKEIAALFPGEYIHIGADEVDESTWRTSCQKFLKEKGLNEDQLHSYFVNRVNEIVKRYGKKTIGWDEIMDGQPDSSITVMYWRGWVPDAPVDAANNGHGVVMSPTSHCYFDYEPDNNSVYHMYKFEPVPTEIAGDNRDNILGAQANIWTEYIPTVARLDYMTMPRMIALSEVTWSSDRDWDDFSNRLKDHFERWDALKIHYRLPDIEDLPSQKVFIDTALFKINLPFAVRELRYTIDGSEPNARSLLYKKPFVIDSSVTVKTLTIGPNGRRGNRKDVHFEKQSYLPAVDVTNVTDGVRCLYYESSVTSVSQIDALNARKDDILSKIEFPPARRAEVFALKYEGFISVPADGIYTFYLSSDDGSTLTIGDRLVINNDGAHGNREVGGQIALRKGFHPYVIRYFDGGGGNNLVLKLDGPAIPKQEVPAKFLRTKKN